MGKELVMSRRIGCPYCGKQLNVPPELVGKKVACPRCANRFRFEEGTELEPSSSVEVAPPNPDLFPPTAPAARRPASSTDDSTVPKPPKQDAQSDYQTARFIKRDANATKVKLGADGRLPHLALATQEKRPDTADESKSTNSWVLVTILCMSVLLSVLILVIDEPFVGASADEKAEARKAILQIYDQAPAGEIRDLLARAQQAYNQGDRAQERECYRQLLDLLNREDAPKYGGFSGEDNKLKELVSELLR